MRIYLFARTCSLRWLFALAAFAAIGACPGVFGEAWAYSFLRIAAFSGGADGATPLAGVMIDNAGNLYGTTSAGGKGGGTVFKIAPGKALKTVYTFCSRTSCTDGSGPQAGLIIDKSGNLYGTTNGGGGHDGGAVFELTAAGVERVLYSFCAKIVGGFCADGAQPVAGVIMDKAGNLYGTTSAGGANGDGVVFELSFHPGKGIWVERVLHSFCSRSGCADGSTPLGGVAMDTAGNLYGTTQLGGAHGAGVVFEVKPSLGSESVLYSFCAQKTCTDGQEPFAGLIIDKTGNLYGTTLFGGNLHHSGAGGGVVFEVVPSRRTEKVLYALCSRTVPVSCADGLAPEAGLLMDALRNLYGTTTAGGNAGRGVIFRMTGPTESVLYSFCSLPGCGEFPVAGVVMDKAGNLYVTTRKGGRGFGTVFELKR
jgi:uncharacterized repeat protein (TIGR03803 family)